MVKSESPQGPKTSLDATSAASANKFELEGKELLIYFVLNLWLTLMSMNRLITNYGTVYSSNGYLSHVNSLTAIGGHDRQYFN